MENLTQQETLFRIKKGSKYIKNAIHDSKRPNSTYKFKWTDNKEEACQVNENLANIYIIESDGILENI